MHADSAHKMSTTLFKVICNAQKSTWNFFFKYQGKMFFDIKKILVKISQEQL